jgi:preprotein translocase subunit SecD
MRPGRQLAFLGAIFVILGAIVWFGGKGGWQDRLEPRLGLDLVGGTRVTLTATTRDGNAPERGDLEQARQIIEDRVNARGVAEAEVVTEGDKNIVISVASSAEDALRDVGQASKLYFRKVITITDGGGPAPEAPPATTAPSPGATPSPGAATPTPQATGTGGGEVMATATPTPNPTSTASASAGDRKVADKRITEDELKAIVGAPAWDAAKGLTAVPTDPGVIKSLDPFSKLDPLFEVTSLSPEMQYYVPQITCEKLDKRIPGAIDVPEQKAVACQSQSKFLLDVAKVAGTDIGEATPQIEQNTGQRVVSLTFQGDGQNKWTELTREAFQNSGDPKCDQSALGDQGKCLVAAVLDNKIVSAPEIQGVLTSTSQISGNFDAQTAQDLADALNFGALAVTFGEAESLAVTATLGEQYLKAGLLAAGIGMALVIIYSFFYYRLLGSVIFLSLVLSGLLTFGMLIFLGREMGFTLTLAGIAGFIVSLGVAADSFVIYFERLKDEIREGRSPRSAVQRAWVRARKTILTANAISLMAAVILYLFSSGPVAGFAFALGLATALDLLVVFLFRYPIMALFARTPAFLSPRVSGLGRVLREAKETN